MSPHSWQPRRQTKHELAHRHVGYEAFPAEVDMSPIRNAGRPGNGTAFWVEQAAERARWRKKNAVQHLENIRLMAANEPTARVEVTSYSIPHE